MTITHDFDEQEVKLFDCHKQTYSNCSCTDTCDNGNPEI